MSDRLVDIRMLGRPRIPGWAARPALIAWFGAMLLLGAGLLAKHVVALPTPARGDALSQSLRAFRAPNAEARWLAIHVLYAECRCSRRIVAHLLSTARPRGWEEVVLWVGVAAPDPALERSYRVHRLTSAELAGLGVDSAPLLVVLDPPARVRYVGGYTNHKQGAAIDDLRIFAAAQQPSAVASLPVFGCAVSERLKRALSVLPSP